MPLFRLSLLFSFSLLRLPKKALLMEDPPSNLLEREPAPCLGLKEVDPVLRGERGTSPLIWAADEEEEEEEGEETYVSTRIRPSIRLLLERSTRLAFAPFLA